MFDETKNSSFFLPGEKRKVKTHFFFKRFDEKKIDLDKVTISSKRLKKDTVATSNTWHLDSRFEKLKCNTNPTTEFSWTQDSPAKCGQVDEDLSWS